MANSNGSWPRKSALDSGSKARLTRRDLVRGLAATSVILAGCNGKIDESSALFQHLTVDGIGDVPERTAEAPLATFPLGLASGDAASASVQLWTACTGTAPLYLAVWEMNGDAYGERVLLEEVVPGDGGFVQVEAADLRTGTLHRYAFFEERSSTVVLRSPIGSFRTARGSTELVPLTFGAVSCTSNGRAMTTLERAGARRDLDFFCLLGDTTYNDGSSTRAAFRGKWAQNLSTAGYRRLRASTSLIATWDDHEVGNNWNPERVDGTLLQNAYAAFFEHLPIRRNESAANRIYRKLSWGKTADVFVLDCRSERRPSTRSSSNAQYVSRAQMDWLKSGLLASTAVFKIILNSVPITNFPGLLDLVANDRWEGYAAARTEIVSFIDNNAIPGVLWIAGDFHMASGGRVSTSGAGSRAVEILAGPGAQTINPLALTLVGSRQFDFVGLANNYTAFALDPSTRSARVRLHDANDRVIADRSYTL